MQSKLIYALSISLVALLLIGCTSPTPLVIVVTATPQPLRATTQPATGTPTPTVKPSATPKPVAIVTTQKGDKFQVLDLGYENDSFIPSKVSWGLPLESGLTVDFEKMKSFEIVKVESHLVTIEITLLDGKTITGQVNQNPTWVLSGKGDYGALKLGIDQVKRVDFQR